MSFRSVTPLGAGFAGARLVVRIRSTRTNQKSGKTSVHERYYLSSQPWQERTPENWINLSRSHWAGVENRNHYRRDATLGEDGTRCRHPLILANLALLRSVSLRLLRRDGCEADNLPAKIERLAANPFNAYKLISNHL